MGEDKVSEASLRGNADELALVGWVHLKPETDPQDEGCYAGDEATKECIEGKCSYQAAVHKLKNASKEDISEVGINDLQLPGGVVRVVVQELVDNSGQAGGRHFQ